MVKARPVSLSVPWRRFSNLLSRMSCVWLAPVCAEKDIMMGYWLGTARAEVLGVELGSFCITTTDLASPVAPTMSVCFLPLISESRSYV